MSAEKPNAERLVKCPRCGTRASFSPENPFRPFCSERCKLIDLGQWADESFRIPAEHTDVSEDQAQRPSDEDLN
ncbi:MAG: DNA gyrase inhibitor YacG [Bdellovibrionaceae bacterium]|nr:DNA gyrase inhibitor YacG [Pseudobdellovibrionaceae bacterium]